LLKNIRTNDSLKHFDSILFQLKTSKGWPTGHPFAVPGTLSPIVFTVQLVRFYREVGIKRNQKVQIGKEKEEGSCFSTKYTFVPSKYAFPL
jgi:hypothetical protein